MEVNLDHFSICACHHDVGAMLIFSHFSICACHRDVGAMLIFSVSFQFHLMSPKAYKYCSRDYDFPSHPFQIPRVPLTQVLPTPCPWNHALRPASSSNVHAPGLKSNHVNPQRRKSRSWCWCSIFRKKRCLELTD